MLSITNKIKISFLAIVFTIQFGTSNALAADSTNPDTGSKLLAAIALIAVLWLMTKVVTWVFGWVGKSPMGVGPGEIHKAGRKVVSAPVVAAGVGVGLAAGGPVGAIAGSSIAGMGSSMGSEKGSAMRGAVGGAKSMGQAQGLPGMSGGGVAGIADKLRTRDEQEDGAKVDGEGFIKFNEKGPVMGLSAEDKKKRLAALGQSTSGVTGATKVDLDDSLEDPIMGGAVVQGAASRGREGAFDEEQRLHKEGAQEEVPGHLVDISRKLDTLNSTLRERGLDRERVDVPSGAPAPVKQADFPSPSGGKVAGGVDDSAELKGKDMEGVSNERRPQRQNVASERRRDSKIPHDPVQNPLERDQE